MSKITDKRAVRDYVRDYYADRNGRNVRIMSDGRVLITVDGNGSQVSHGVDVSGGVFFTGYYDDLLRHAVLDAA